MTGTETQRYSGSCHCGYIRFTFEGSPIVRGLRCNCSICSRKGVVMTHFVVAADQMQIDAQNDSLGTYQFGSRVARHHFCRNCGISPFQGTLRQPGSYRINVGCVDGVDALALPVEIFDGRAL